MLPFLTLNLLSCFSQTYYAWAVIPSLEVSPEHCTSFKTYLWLGRLLDEACLNLFGVLRNNLSPFFVPSQYSIRCDCYGNFITLILGLFENYEWATVCLSFLCLDYKPLESRVVVLSHLCILTKMFNLSTFCTSCS